jgi:hypothetical protein
MDYCLGVAELADAVAAGQPSRLSPELALHINELTLAIHNSATGPRVHDLKTTVKPMEPSPLRPRGRRRDRDTDSRG